MSTAITYFIAQTIKTTALLSAVVFLLFATGCSSTDHRTASESYQRNQPTVHRKRPVRKRASDYSRLPNNYPASWQTSTVGY